MYLKALNASLVLKGDHDLLT